MLSEVLKQMTSGLSETLVYVAIALVTLMGVVKCIYPVLRNGTLLSRAVMKLEKSAADAERPVWREARFLGRALRPDWQRFLLNAGQLDLRGMPCSTDEYINEDTVVYKPGHAQLAELIPSLLTSLGILGTFIGLMEGLTSLDFTSANGTMQSIPTLLDGMRFAFATSVAGITCSLAFNVTNRIMVGRAFKALDSFDEAFYELAMPRPLDPEVQMMCQKQDDEVSRQRIADNMASRLSGTMEMAISRALHPLTMSMDNLIQGVTHEQVEGMQRVVGTFLQQMNVSLGGQFTALSETLNLINRGQIAAQESLQHTMKMAESLSADAERIQKASHEIAGSMEKEALVPSDHAELLELMRQSVRQQQESIQALDSLREGLEALKESLPAAQATNQEAFAGEVEALTDALARMKSAVDDLTERLNGSQTDEMEHGEGKAWPASFTEGA